MSAAGWEIVIQSAGERTSRLRVPGGWLYCTFMYSVTMMGMQITGGPALCFVPDPAAQPIEEPLEEDAPVVVDSTDDVGVAS